jgi:hypothetical protein
MRLMLGHVPHQTTTRLSLGVPLPRECVTFSSFYFPLTHCRYICGRLPAYHNLRSLTWCIANLTEKQQISFSKSVAALFSNGLSQLTLFYDSRSDKQPADPATADLKRMNEGSAFSIKGIVAAAASSKALEEINFCRLSIGSICLAAVVDAPAHVQRCLKFHGVYRPRVVPLHPP